MTRPITLVLVLALALGACGGGEPVDGDTGIRVPPSDAGPAYVEDTSVAVSGDAVEVTLSGDLPTPCHAVQTTITAARETDEDAAGDRRVDVTVWSERQAADDEACAQVLSPFTTSVSTPIPEGVAVDVYVNDEFQGTVRR